MTQNEINHNLLERIKRLENDLQHEHDRINYTNAKLVELSSKPNKLNFNAQTMAIIVSILTIIFMLVLVLKCLLISF